MTTEVKESSVIKFVTTIPLPGNRNNGKVRSQGHNNLPFPWQQNVPWLSSSALQYLMFAFLRMQGFPHSLEARQPGLAILRCMASGTGAEWGVLAGCG